MKNQMIILLTILCISLLSFPGCPDDGITPPTNPLQVVDVTCTEVTLNISLAGGSGGTSVTLTRDDAAIATIAMRGSDSLFTDSLLQPNKTYNYTLTDGEWVARAQATTLDTTSHDVQWQVPDTLGVQGLIRDVWVFSRDNAWAVGEIYLADGTGTPDMGNPYNAAHWDGSKWEVKQIPTAGIVGSGYYPIYTIFAFAPSDIWIFSEAGSYSHWNGQNWTTAYVAERQGGGQKLWGTSSSNLFLVGTNGSISQYDGNVWTKQESHTTVDLQDIWGVDNSHVWATGTNTADGHCVVLQYDGKQWTTIYDNAGKPFSEFFGFSTLWTNKADRIYLAGGSRTQLMNLNNKTFQQLNISAEWVALQIRGRNRQDIFEARDGSEITHFNGVSWHLYPEIKTLNEGYATFTSVYPSQDVVLIGGFYFTGLNGFPVVVRGYR